MGDDRDGAGTHVQIQSHNRKVWLRGVLLLAAVVMFSLAGWWKWGVSQEPAYQGRSLSSWLEDLDTRPWRTNTAAATALRAMGTEAIPRLVRDVTASDPAWREPAVRWLRAKGFPSPEAKPALKARSRACRALWLLGEHARPALPLLIEEVGNERGRSRIPWVGISAIFEHVPETIPTIIQELDTPSHRAQAAYFLGIFGERPNLTVPFLIECARDGDWETRLCAVKSLERFGAEAASAEPVVRALLSDPNASVAEAAARVLEKIQSDAEPDSIP